MNHIPAKKSLGQNFLHDQTALQNIVAAATIEPADTIIEIGPGKGALTELLVSKANHVLAVEKDDRLIPFLQEKFITAQNFELIHGDALIYNPPKTDYKVVANIPYYITSPLLTHYLYEQHLENNLPKRIVVLIQKEVAEKICHKKKNSVLSLSIKFFGQPEYICTVSANAFDPVPKVDSAVIAISDITPPPTQQYTKVMKLIKHCFKNPRKTLHNNIKMLFAGDAETATNILEQADFDSKIRPEKLSVIDWIKLWEVYEEFKA